MSLDRSSSSSSRNNSIIEGKTEEEGKKYLELKQRKQREGQLFFGTNFPSQLPQHTLKSIQIKEF